MTAFVQIIEYSTSRFDEIETLTEEWRRRHPERGYDWLVACADRDKPGSYVTIVQFSSYEDAMRNSEDPLTTEFAEKMAKLTDQPPVFRNLDVRIAEGAVS
ncbi:MAG TPA: hypothetical protein VF049_17985 [Nocardioidaceae bacterium]|jgi:hypothetical protein